MIDKDSCTHQIEIPNDVPEICYWSFCKNIKIGEWVMSTIFSPSIISEGFFHKHIPNFFGSEAKNYGGNKRDIWLYSWPQFEPLYYDCIQCQNFHLQTVLKVKYLKPRYVLQWSDEQEQNHFWSKMLTFRGVGHKFLLPRMFWSSKIRLKQFFESIFAVM